MGGAERRLVGMLDRDLLHAGLADDGRALLSRDRLLEDGPVLGDAEHVGRRDAVDDGRAKPAPALITRSFLGPSAAA